MKTGASIIVRPARTLGLLWILAQHPTYQTR